MFNNSRKLVIAMKKTALILLALLLILPTTASAAMQYTALYVGSNKAFVNDEQKQIDENNPGVIAFVENDRTYVPVRFITESYGGTVVWNEATQTVDMNVNGIAISLTLDKSQIIINGKTEELDVPPVLRNERTFLPLRACVEAIGKKVFYDRGLILISDIEDILDKNFDADIVDAIIAKFK